MTIRAYTFDVPTDVVNMENAQNAPYSAAVDARVRRDMFHGHGDLIASGDREGHLNLNPLRGNIGDTFTVKFHDGVTFMAGGRLFTISNQAVNLRTKAAPNNINIGTASLIVDINTKHPEGEYVTITDSPSYDTGWEAWESDQFSTVFNLIAVKTGAEVKIYPGIEHVAQNAAGSTFTLSDRGQTMNGRRAPWRGQMTDSGTLTMCQTGDVWNLFGDIGDLTYTKFENGVFKFAPSLAPYFLDITKGAIVLHISNRNESAILIGDLSNDIGTENGEHFLFKVSNIEGLTGAEDIMKKLKNGSTRVVVQATISEGKWEYLK